MICVISWNEKGFWQADVFESEDCDTPDWFCTGKKGEDQFAVINKAVQEFGKTINLAQGCFGECVECGCEYVRRVDKCECGGEIAEYA